MGPVAGASEDTTRQGLAQGMTRHGAGQGRAHGRAQGRAQDSAGQGRVQGMARAWRSLNISSCVLNPGQFAWVVCLAHS